MADTRTPIKKGIDDVAEKAKEVTDQVADKTKATVLKVGKQVKSLGRRIKDLAN